MNLVAGALRLAVQAKQNQELAAKLGVRVSSIMPAVKVLIKRVDEGRDEGICKECAGRLTAELKEIEKLFKLLETPLGGSFTDRIGNVFHKLQDHSEKFKERNAELTMVLADITCVCVCVMAGITSDVLHH